MKRHEVETTGFPIVGPEEDYFSGTKPMECHGISSLLRGAGCEAIEWQVASAFGYPGEKTWAKYVSDYRKQTGRKFPPLFKVKITIEAEQVPDSESNKYWEEMQAAYRKARKARAEQDNKEKRSKSSV
jgi:hypothetical protein